MKKVFVRTGAIVIILATAIIGCKAEDVQKERNVKINPKESSSFFYIFKDGKAKCSVVLPVNASSNMKKAVAVFCSTIKDGYNIDIPAENRNEFENKIKLVIEDRTLEKEDKAEVTFPDDKTMVITGGEPGVRRTLFYLLEKFGGLRFLYRGTYGNHYPQITEIAVPCNNFIHESAYTLGRCTDQTNYLADRRYFWNWEVNLGAKKSIENYHALSIFYSGKYPKFEVIFPLRDYNSGKKKVNDKVFPIRNGERYLPYKNLERGRNAWQPCFTSQETADEAVKNLNSYLEKNPNTEYISLSVNDSGGFCECKKCLEMDIIGGKTGTQGYRNRSESYYRWVNKVVVRIAKKFPNVRFGVIAYRETIDPPTIKLHPAIVPTLTLDFNATIDKDVKRKYKNLITLWSKKAESLGFHSYDFGCLFYSLPKVYFKEQKEMIEFFHKNNGKYGSSEGSQYFPLPDGPKTYLFYKLTENPYLDLEETIYDWCEASVGKEAAPYLRKYYAFWEDFWRNKAIKTPWWNTRGGVYLPMIPFGSYMYGLEEGDMAKCRRIMEKVIELAEKHGIDDQKKRAQLLMKIFEWHEAAASACAAEIRSPDGTVTSAEKAAKLVREIPQCEKSFELWKKIPGTIENWYAWRLVLKGVDKGIIVNTLMAASDFSQDKIVKDELELLSKNKSVNFEVKLLANVMLKSTDINNYSNLFPNGSFEKNDEIGFKTRSDIHGNISLSQKYAATGKSSMQCVIKHCNFTATKMIHNLKADTSYYFSAKIYLPEDQQPSLEGRLRFWGNPTRDLDKNTCWPATITKFNLTQGKWNYVSAIVPANSMTIGNRLTINFRNYEKDTVIYVDDVQLLELSTSNPATSNPEKD